MKDIDRFLDRLNKVVCDLEKPGKEFSDLYTQYDGNEFDKQHYLAGRLDEALLSATHETASMIDFMGIDIRTSTDFIDFRKSHKDISGEDLENIIDHPEITSIQKLSLAKKSANGNTKLLLDQMQIVRFFWKNYLVKENIGRYKNNSSNPKLRISTYRHFCNLYEH